MALMFLDRSTVTMVLAILFMGLGLLLMIPALLAISWMDDIEIELKRRGLSVLGRRTLNQWIQKWSLSMMFWATIAVAGSWLVALAAKSRRYSHVRQPVVADDLAEHELFAVVVPEDAPSIAFGEAGVHAQPSESGDSGPDPIPSRVSAGHCQNLLRGPARTDA